MVASASTGGPEFINNTRRVSIGATDPGAFIGYATETYQDIVLTFEAFVDSTGGRAYVGKNDLESGFREAVSDSSQYYRLGYYLDRSKTKPGWNRLAVKLVGEHLTVRARSGFFVPDKSSTPATFRDNDLVSAFQSPLEYSAIALVAKWRGTQPSNDAGKKHILYDVHLQPAPLILSGTDNNHLALEFLAQARTPKGKTVGDPIIRKVDGHPTAERMAAFREKGLDGAGGIDLAPGEYPVRFVLRDDLSGRIGSVDAPLKVE